MPMQFCQYRYISGCIGFGWYAVVCEYDAHTHIHACIQTGRQTETYTDRLTDRHTDRRTDRHIDR